MEESFINKHLTACMTFKQTFLPLTIVWHSYNSKSEFRDHELWSWLCVEMAYTICPCLDSIKLCPPFSLGITIAVPCNLTFALYYHQGIDEWQTYKLKLNKNWHFISVSIRISFCLTVIFMWSVHNLSLRPEDLSRGQHFTLTWSWGDQAKKKKKNSFTELKIGRGLAVVHFPWPRCGCGVSLAPPALSFTWDLRRLKRCCLAPARRFCLQAECRMCASAVGEPGDINTNWH